MYIVTLETLLEKQTLRTGDIKIMNVKLDVKYHHKGVVLFVTLSFFTHVTEANIRPCKL